MPIVVRKRPPPGAAQDAALNDAVMRQSVVQHEIAGAEQVADRCFVGRMSADEHNRILHADEVGDGPLQLAMDRFLARHQAAGRYAGAETVDGVRAAGLTTGSPDMPR